MKLVTSISRGHQPIWDFDCLSPALTFSFLRLFVSKVTTDPDSPGLTVVPELDHVIANLELMPLRINERKNAKIGQRQRSLARKLNEAGLLSKTGLAAVLAM